MSTIQTQVCVCVCVGGGGVHTAKCINVNIICTWWTLRENVLRILNKHSNKYSILDKIKTSRML